MASYFLHSCILDVTITFTFKILLLSLAVSPHQPVLSSSLPRGRPTCKPQCKPKNQVKAKTKSKQRRKSVKPTRKPLPTLPPFDFKRYLLEKDNRDFKLLIDQPVKCLLEGGEGEGPPGVGGGGGGGGAATAAAPYMLIAVKSVAADFDKRQVTCYCGLLTDYDYLYFVIRLQSDVTCFA